MRRVVSRRNASRVASMGCPNFADDEHHQFDARLPERKFRVAARFRIRLPVGCFFRFRRNGAAEFAEKNGRLNSALHIISKSETNKV